MTIPYPQPPQNKDGLLSLIRDERQGLYLVLAPLGEEDITRPLPPDGWSVKDHLAHVAAWERRLLATLQDRPAHEGLGLDRLLYEGSSTDEVNALLFERDKDRPVDDVMADFQMTHGMVLIAVTGLSEADLRRPFRPDDHAAGPLMAHIATNTYEHYVEHATWISRALAQDDT